MAEPIDLRELLEKLQSLPDRIAKAMADVMPRLASRAPATAVGANAMLPPPIPAPVPGEDSARPSPVASQPPPLPSTPPPTPLEKAASLRKESRTAGIGVLHALGGAGVPLAGGLAQKFESVDRVKDAWAAWSKARREEREGSSGGADGAAEADAASPTPAPSRSPAPPASAATEDVQPPPMPPEKAEGPDARQRIFPCIPWCR